MKLGEMPELKSFDKIEIEYSPDNEIRNFVNKEPGYFITIYEIDKYGDVLSQSPILCYAQSLVNIGDHSNLLKNTKFIPLSQIVNLRVVN